MQSIFENRTYRTMPTDADLVSFSVTVKESNLFIQAKKDLTDDAYAAVQEARSAIERYIVFKPEFQTSLVPIDDDPYAPSIVKEMICGSRLSGVGPMAAVAGAIAEYVARRLAQESGEVIVENGGDVFLVSSRTRVAALFTDKKGPQFGIEVSGAENGLGISSSSAVIGRSLSLGGADLATVAAKTGALSDAAATALGNRIKEISDIEGGIASIMPIPGVLSAVVMKGERIGAAGQIKIVAL